MKKVAIVTTTWSDDNFIGMMQGVSEYIEGKDIFVDVFNAYDITFDKERTLNGLLIFNLPVPSQYDGLIAYTNSAKSDKALSEVFEAFREFDKPIVCVDRKIEGYPCILTDNYASEYAMTQHMIKEHGCKRFQFVGGNEDYYDNQERYRAFCDCLRDNGITCDSDYVSFHSFLAQDGRDAFSRIVDNNMELPEAVVCANDKMAIGYCLEAYERGYSPRRDFLICGFDNIMEGQEFFPSITSVNKNIQQMFVKAFEYIYEIENPVDIPMETFLSGYVKNNLSCGCHANFDALDKFRRTVVENSVVKEIEKKHRQSRMMLCACKSFDEFQSAIISGKKKLGLYDVAVCIKSEVYMEGKAISKLCYSYPCMAYSTDGIEEINRERTIKPKKWNNKKDVIYVYSTLYYFDTILGYAVMPYVKEQYSRKFHEDYIDSISIAVENIMQKIMIDNMNHKFKSLYIIDQMTGLYNRFGFSSLSGKLFGKYNGRVFVVYIDIDNLKGINDNFGHGIGDEAIIGTAYCIKKVFGDDAVCVRMGGDEFLVMDEFISEEALLDKEQLLSKLLDTYSEHHSLPVKLEASIGHSYNVKEIGSTELGRMLKAADNNMYQEKKRKKDMNVSEVE